MRNRSIGLALLLIFLSLPVTLSVGGEREECHVCGMWIDMYMNTRHVALLHDGSRVSFCSIACASKYLRQHGGSVEKVWASDYLSTELVEARSAFYLSGSDVFGVMTYTSRLAFSNRAEAEKFRAVHGGRIIDFEGALSELAQE